MTHTHAVPSGTPHRAGQCAWVHTYSGVRLDCEDPAIPGGVECADHLIARVHSTPDPDVRRFGPVTVTIPEVQA